jgi:hypothetical protein
MKAMYKGDERYSKVGVLMDLLGIKDVSTTRQEKNGTIVWRLPIKNNHKPTSFIEVASFSTGYVRNQNSGYSNYQLNKRCQNEPHYYPEYNYDEDTCTHTKTGKYLKFNTRGCVLIPIEIDRLEYLISYCLKNYYIKRANEVVEGKYVSQWYHDWSLERANETYSENTGAMARINDLEEKLDAMTEDRDNKSDRVINLSLQYEVLQNKLAKINRISE